MPIASAGKKDPALAARIRSGKTAADEAVYDYVVGRKPLRVGNEIRQPGDLIPEAATWPRLEGWIRSGAVEQRPKGSVVVAEPEAEPEPASAPPPKSPPRRPVAAPPEDEAPPRPVLRPRKGTQ